jgi:hypothetical protein
VTVPLRSTPAVSGRSRKYDPLLSLPMQKKPNLDDIYRLRDFAVLRENLSRLTRMTWPR